MSNGPAQPGRGPHTSPVGSVQFVAVGVSKHGQRFTTSARVYTSGYVHHGRPRLHALGQSATTQSESCVHAPGVRPAKGSFSTPQPAHSTTPRSQPSRHRMPRLSHGPAQSTL